MKYLNFKKNNYIAQVENLSAMICKFIAISGEKEGFFREFELDKNNTLLDFHKTIQEELEYDESQLASFFTTTDKWEKEEEFTLVDMGSTTTLMEEVIIDEILIEKNQKLIYIFDLFNERVLFIEYLGAVPRIEDREYPLCTDSKGASPPQIIISDVSENNSPDNDYYDNDLHPDADLDSPDLENIEDFEEI